MAYSAEEFRNRLKEAMNGKGSVHAISVQAGISDSLVRGYLKDQLPGIDNVARLATVLGISLDWLVFGTVSLPVTPSGYKNPDGGQGKMGATALHESVPVYGAKTPEPEFLPVPRLSVRASAGNGSLITEEEQLGALAFRREFLRSISSRVQDLVAIEVDGDSMSPTLLPGEVILVNIAAAKRAVRDGIWVIRIGDSVLVKRLQVLGRDRVMVRSDNPQFEAYERKLGDDADEFQILGQVVWGGRRYA